MSGGLITAVLYKLRSLGDEDIGVFISYLVLLKCYFEILFRGNEISNKNTYVLSWTPVILFLGGQNKNKITDVLS